MILSRAAYIIGAIGIVGLSFEATLFALNRYLGDPTFEPLYTSSISRSEISAETELGDLPKPKDFDWYVVRGLNVKATTDKPAVSGQTTLRLIALPNHNIHSLVAQYHGLYKNGVYRIVAWVRPQAGANVELVALDEPDSTPTNNGVAIFDLINNTIVSSTGVRARGIELGKDNWQQVWVDQATTDGRFLVAVRPARGATDDFNGDGRLGLTLGGIQVSPHG
jgi:hypothetical protein